MHHHLGYNGASLYDTTIRSQVALEHCYAAGRAVRILYGSDDFGIQIHAALYILRNGLAAYGYQIGI